MDRTAWRALLGGTLIAVFLSPLLCAWCLGAQGARQGLRSAAADEDPDPGTPTTEQPAKSHGIQWAESWTEARQRAETEGRLIFAYFGRHEPG